MTLFELYVRSIQSWTELAEHTCKAYGKHIDDCFKFYLQLLDYDGEDNGRDYFSERPRD